MQNIECNKLLERRSIPTEETAREMTRGDSRPVELAGVISTLGFEITRQVLPHLSDADLVPTLARMGSMALDKILPTLSTPHLARMLPILGAGARDAVLSNFSIGQLSGALKLVSDDDLHYVLPYLDGVVLTQFLPYLPARTLSNAVLRMGDVTRARFVQRLGDEGRFYNFPRLGPHALACVLEVLSTDDKAQIMGRLKAQILALEPLYRLMEAHTKESETSGQGPGAG